MKKYYVKRYGNSMILDGVGLAENDTIITELDDNKEYYVVFVFCGQATNVLSLIGVVEKNVLCNITRLSNFSLRPAYCENLDIYDGNDIIALAYSENYYKFVANVEKQL